MRSGSEDEPRCRHCGRVFTCNRGIWDLLPVEISHLQGKEREKGGWALKTSEAVRKGYRPPPEHYLALPDHPHPYYRAAAWYLRIVLEYGKPWQGKRALELGAAECWGTRKLVEAGAETIALDYDPHRMLHGQVLLDSLPIHFERVQGDAEKLPFRDDTFQRVFCCSVLHHFFDLPRAVREISRILSSGGLFFGIHEAYHPPYYRRERIVRMHEDTIPNLSAGINERSYTAADYRRFFREAGMEVEYLHPRWDVREGQAGELTVRPGINLLTPDFLPSTLGNRAWRKDLPGLLSRLLLIARLWTLLKKPTLFSLIRFPLLNWSTKDKILVGRKP